MKTNSLIWIGAMVLYMSTASAQIRLEYSYDYSGTYTSLKYSGDKLFIMDVPASQCRIYNMDHSLWKTIHLPVPANNYLYDIKYVSEGLFTNDEHLALAYVYYSYNASTQVYSYNAKIISESGQELLSIPGCLYLDVHDMKQQGFKLLAYSYNFNVWPETVKTLVYSLPGQLATKANSPEIIRAMASPAFPNPASSFLILPYKLPDGNSEGLLTLSDMQGHAVRTFRVDSHFEHLRIDVRSLPAGTYVHSLTSGGQIVETGKVIVGR